MTHTFRIAWIAIRELLYERVFYIVLSFSVLSLGLSLCLGQMTYAEQAKLTLDFMLAGIQISMILFSVFVGISLFQKEIQTGSVSMVLSKPISRGVFLLGKYLGQVTVQTVVIALMGALTVLVGQYYGMTSPLAILQAIVMIAFEVSLITALTYVFAVNSGALTTAVVTLCVFAIGHSRQAVLKTVGPKLNTNLVWRAAQSLLPDLDIFNIKALASYGFTVTNYEIGMAALYALVCICFYLTVAILCFNRKDILT